MARTKSTTAVASLLVKTGNGNLRSFYVLNVAAATRYLWIFDGTTAAGAPASLIAGPFPVATGEGLAVDYASSTRSQAPDFSTGCFFASSTTAATFTQSGGADLMGIEAEVS